MAQSGRQADDAAIAAGGYGYRGRIGFLQPGIVGEAIPVQFYRMAPPGVTLVTTSLGLRELTVGEVESALDKTEAAARELGKSKPGCIVFGGSPTVAVPGFGSENTIVQTVARASGVPTFSAQTAAIEALKAHGIKRIAVATVFPDDVNAMVKTYLEKAGLEVAAIAGLGIPYPVMQKTPLKATADLGRRCFEAAKNADALYFAAASQPCVDNIDLLEKELGTFVIASLQTSLWKALTILGIGEPIQGYGRLLSEPR